MKKFLMAMMALSFALAGGLTGCGRSERCTVDHVEKCDLCGSVGGALREIDTPPSLGRGQEWELEDDLIQLDSTARYSARPPAPAPQEPPQAVERSGIPGKYAPAAPAAPAAPEKVIVPPEGAEEPETDADGAEFSEEIIVEKIRIIEEAGKAEPEIIQEIIEIGYDEVPSVLSPELKVDVVEETTDVEETAVAEEPVAAPVAPAVPAAGVKAVADAAAEEADIAAEIVAEEEEALREMAVDYQSYMDIDAYIAESPVEDASAPAPEPVAAPAGTAEPDALPGAEDFGKDVENLPIPVSAVAADIDAAEAASDAAAEEDFLTPPPLYAGSGTEPAFGADFGAAEEAAEKKELSLEGFDDMDLEYFGSISESLLNPGGEG